MGVLKLDTRAEWIKMNVSPDERIVDLGAGNLFVYQMTGLRPELIVDINYRVVNGELYWKMQHKDVVKKVPKLYKDFLIADVTKKLPLPDSSFDVAVVTEVLEHVDKPRAVVEEGLRLAPKLVGTVPAGEHKSHFDIKYTLYKDDLERILKGYTYRIAEIITPHWHGYGFVVTR